MRRTRLQSFLSRCLQAAIVTIALGYFFLTPVGAQAPTFPVTLDGYRLFEISDSGQYSAEQRAKDTGAVLQAAVQSAQPPQVEVAQQNQLPVILVNGRYLLSVTTKDAPQGRPPEEQAQQWAQQIQLAIERGRRQRTGQYFRQALVWVAVWILLAISLHWGLGWLWRRWLQRLIPQEATTPEADLPPSGIELLYQTTLVAMRSLVWLLAAYSISSRFPLTRNWNYRVTEVLRESFISPLISLGENSYSVVDIVSLLGLFLGLIVFSRTATKVLRSRVLQATGVNRGAQETVAFLANYSLILIGTIVLLQLWGLDLSSLAILISVLGVGIGFGLQGIAKEFVSGLVIIFERPIQVGDFIELAEMQGTVERISVRSTEIRTVDQLSVIIPNSRFLESEVINWSHRTPISRLRIPVGVAYGSSLSTVRSALIDAAKDYPDPDVLTDPAPRVFFKGFGESSLDFELLIWIAEPRKQFGVKSDLYFRIEAILRHRKIEIPFPQRDLHLRSGSLPVELPAQLQDSLADLSAGLAAWLKQNAQDNPPNGQAKSAPEEHAELDPDHST